MSDEQQNPQATDPTAANYHPAEVVFAVIAFLFAAFLATQISSQTTAVSGQPWTKQPALWSVIAIIGMVIFGALEIFHLWRRRSTIIADEIKSEITVWARALEYLLWFMAYVAVVPVVGYLPTTIVLAILLCIRLGYRSRKMAFTAVAVAFGIVVIFKSFLQVKIPGAMAYEYLPAAVRNFMILNF